MLAANCQVGSSHLRWPMCWGDEAKALHVPEHRLPMTHQDQDRWPCTGCCHHSPAFAVTCSATSPCQEASPQVSLIFLHTGDKSFWQSYLAITPMKPVLRPQIGRQTWQNNHLLPHYLVVAILDTSGKELHLAIPASTCKLIRGGALPGSSLAVKKMKGSFVHINGLCCIYRRVKLWKPHALNSLALLLIGMFFFKKWRF